MPLPELEVDHFLLKRWLKLFSLRLACFLAHFIGILDGLNSIGRYPLLETCFNGGACPGDPPASNDTKAVPVTRKPKPAMVVNCPMNKANYKEDINSYLFNFNMAFFVVLAFFAVAVINFIVKCVINFRLVLCPVFQEEDICGRKVPTIWHKMRDRTFNFATFPCDTAILSCIAGLYANKRGAQGLGCWQCFLEPTCTKEEDLDSILFLSSLSLNMNFFLVLVMVFYKGVLSWYDAMDPEKCDCHCEAPRCITGCFISLITTSVILTPPFLVLSQKYYGVEGLEEERGNMFSMIMNNMMLIGCIIWGCIGLFACVIMPLKMVLLRNKEPKK